jgi:uncharacterized membrane protein
VLPFLFTNNLTNENANLHFMFTIAYTLAIISLQVKNMKNLLIGLINIIGDLTIVDMIVLIALMTFIILIISVIYIYKISTLEEDYDDEREVNDMLDLKEITKQIEEAPRAVNINLTPYEQEQEEKAIISYDELVRSNNSMKINYKEEKQDAGVTVKQVDLDNIAKYDKNSSDTKVNIISYEKEEAFLEALKNLKNMLS